MTGRFSPVILRVVLLAAVALAYFVIYPGDLAAVIAPVVNVLGISQAVSPWLYAVVAVGMVCWTVARIWGGKRIAGTEREVPPTP